MGGAMIRDASAGGGCNGDHTSDPIHNPVDCGQGDGRRDVDPSDRSMTRADHQCWADLDDQVDRHQGLASSALPKDGQCLEVCQFPVDLQDEWREAGLTTRDARPVRMAE